MQLIIALTRALIGAVVNAIIAGRHQCLKVVKLIRAYGGYLGTQRRRRTWRPTKHSEELEASIEPEISEWGNPKYSLLNT